MIGGVCVVKVLRSSPPSRGVDGRRILEGRAGNAPLYRRQVPVVADRRGMVETAELQGGFFGLGGGFSEGGAQAPIGDVPVSHLLQEQFFGRLLAVPVHVQAHGAVLERWVAKYIGPAVEVVPHCRLTMVGGAQGGGAMKQS